MEMIPVASSLLKSVGYDPEKKELHVEFYKRGIQGGIYVYRGIPQKIYDAMMEDSSAGGYFIQNIKGKFEFSKELNGPPRQT